jgi:hypothetical protein
LAKAWLVGGAVVVAAAVVADVEVTTVEVEKAVIVAGVEAWVCVSLPSPSETERSNKMSFTIFRTSNKCKKS